MHNSLGGRVMRAAHFAMAACRPSACAALVVALLSLAAISAPPAHAADLNATPSTLATVFKNAQGGDVIHLAGGNYGTFSGGAKTSMVTIQADSGVSATIGASLDGSAYIAFKNLTVTSAYIVRSHDIQFVGNHFTGATQIDTVNNSDMRILLDGNTHDGINVCSTCYEGRITVVGSDNTSPNGVKIVNSHFSGGNSDGIQITGNAYGTQIGPGNVFENIVEVDQTHTDAIQLYHSRHTQIVGNVLHDNETGIMAPDGADHELIQDNVITTKRDGTGYPWPIVLGTDNGSSVIHNTLPDGACNWSMRCGTLRVYSGNAGIASKGTIVKDNIVGALDVSGVSQEAYNLVAAGGSGTSDIKGVPTFVGGSKPTTRSGFGLTSTSLGVANASDGTDRGIDASSGGTTAPAPTPSPTPTNFPAAAVWTAPSGAVTGTPVTLDGTGSTGDPALTCTWSFENADGSTVWETATGCKVQKTFQNADTKYVRLTVTDGNGDTDQNVQSFAVTAPSTTTTSTSTTSSSTPTTTTTTTDTTAPDTSISAPTGVIATRTTSISFTATESATFQCQVDGGSWTACTSPWTTPSLTDGSHSVAVRATDAAGNTDATPASATFSVDATAPHTTITSAPPATTTSTTASFSFTADDAGARFQCSLDGGAWIACTSSYTVKNLARASHTMVIRGIDAAGNVESPGARWSWSIGSSKKPRAKVATLSLTGTSTPTAKTTSTLAAPKTVRVAHGRFRLACSSGCTVRAVTRVHGHAVTLARGTGKAVKLTGAGRHALRLAGRRGLKATVHVHVGKRVVRSTTRLRTA